ncbi:MAG: HDOD domain-containing protein [Aquabacterium sp.]|nr:HDOD domain-containing protein [Aquabacterium sp.]
MSVGIVERLPVAAPPPCAQVELAWLRQQVEGLPALPQAVSEALLMLRRDDTSVDDCADCIARDPAITARILRLANSAFYGRAGRIATVHDAVILLGRRTLGTLLTAAAVSAGFGPCQCAGFDFADFWRHAFGTAIAAQALAAAQGGDEALAFSAGLLHDIGSLALVAYAPEAMAGALAWSRSQDLPLHLAERETLGVDHAQAGAMIAAHWHFPPPVVAAIVDHHATALVAPADGAASLTDLVQAADAIAHALDLNASETERVPDIDLSVWARLDLNPSQYQRVFERTEQGVAALALALAL